MSVRVCDFVKLDQIPIEIRNKVNTQHTQKPVYLVSTTHIVLLFELNKNIVLGLALDETSL